MELVEGYLYHIKDECFDVLNDPMLMQNKDNKRPTYFVLKDMETNLFWFIPLSTKIDKYKREIDKKIVKHGRCTTILIVEIAAKDTAVLIQNSFPVIEKYIDHIHTINNMPVKVSTSIKEKIIKNFLSSMQSYKHGNKGVFFSDITNNIQIMKEMQNID